MALSKYYETIKFFLLGHPWAFKNLKNFKGEDFGICLSSHELSLLKTLALVSLEGQNIPWEWGSHEKHRVCYGGTFSERQ